MQTLTIVHLSDLHLSEDLMKDPDSRFRLPHRYGHDVQIFLALDKFLKDTPWDLLVITGDISRIGNAESFLWARNWLENEIVTGNTRIGLNLSKSAARHYIMIPGNHDRFNGQLRQSSLDHYHIEFPAIRPGDVISRELKGFKVNFHLFDSTTTDGGFAHGRIEQKSMVAKTLSDEEIDVALLHHHFLQPPKHAREIATELYNSADVAAYMLNTGFDCICFGHTHKGYIGRPNVEILSGILNDKRATRKFWRKLMPKFFLQKFETESLVSYPREPAQNGQLPTLESYFDFLYLRQRGHSLKGPSQFSTIRDFYVQMQAVQAESRMREELEKTKSKRILISLAPSACQAEARWKGFHVLNLSRKSDKELDIGWDRFQFDGGAFNKLAGDQYQA